MGARQELAERLAPQHVRTSTGEQLIGRVRLAAGELLGGERATKPFDVAAHPDFEPVERQIVLSRYRHLTLRSIVYDEAPTVSCP